MNPDGLDFVEDVLRGYDEWKRKKAIQSDDQLSVSHYIDELAKQRQSDDWIAIYEFASEEFNTDADVGYEVRRRMGINKG